MSELQETLDKVDREIIIRDVVQLIDDEVKSKGGLTGAALKGGYSAVKRLENGNMIRNAVDGLLDDFTDALSPLYEEYRADGSAGSFESYIDDRPEEATDALLSITDGKAENADNKFLKKTYSKLRGQAEHHVTDALPRVGRLIDKHTPQN